MGFPGSDGGGDLGTPRRSARLAPRRVCSSGGGTERCVLRRERHIHRLALPRVGRRARVDVRRPAFDASRAEPRRSGAQSVGLPDALWQRRFSTCSCAWPSAPTARKFSCASFWTPAAVLYALRRSADTSDPYRLGARTSLHSAAKAENRLELARASDLYI